MKPFYLFSLLTCAILLNSCTTESSEEGASDVAGGVTFIASDFKYAVDKRTSLEITDDGAEFNWAEDDMIGIFPDKGTQVSFSMAAGAGTKTASFDGGGWSLKPSSSYAAYYPLLGEFYLDKRSIPVDYTEQVQTGNASTAHLGAYDYMGAVATTPENGNVIFKFQHLGALIQLNIPLEKACTPTSVVLHTDEESFVTKGSLDLTSLSLKVTAKEKSKDFTVTLTDISFSEDYQTATVYFMMSPVDLSGKAVSVTVNCDGEASALSYSFAGRNFESGLAYSVKANAPIKAVDLGLSVKWANCNVGASSPEEYGGYYAWGETEEKDVYDVSTYQHYDKENNKYIFIGNNICGTQYDVAHVKWGDSWRMPTAAEIQELLENCTFSWISYNGVYGQKVVGPNGNSFFLPATGYYSSSNNNSIGTSGYFWSGTLHEENNNNTAYGLFIRSGDAYSFDGNISLGRSVRPVSE